MFLDLVESLPSSVFYCDLDHKLLVVNKSFSQLVGVEDKDTLINKTLEQVLPPEFLAKIMVSMANLSAENQTTEVYFDILNANQEFRSYSAHLGYSYKGNAGSGGIAVSIRDVTHLTQHKETLVQEHELLRTVIDILPAFIYAKDAESKFIMANEVLAGYMGCRNADELIGKSDFDFFPYKFAMKYYCDEQEVIVSGRPKLNIQESCGFNDDGPPLWLNTTKVPLKDSSGKIVGIVGSGMDITQQKKINDQLFELQEIVNHSNSCAFLLSSHDNWLVKFCSITVSIFGYEVEDFSSRKLNFLEIVHPDDVKDLGEQTINAFRSGVANFSMEYRIKLKTGGYCWVEDHKYLRALQEDGSFLFQSLITDVTKRHTMQQERDEMELQLRQAQKLEAVGQLAAGIAHEINTPIQFISDNLQFLLDSANDFMSFYKGVMSTLDQEDSNHVHLLEKFRDLAEELDLKFLSTEVPLAISQSLEGAQRVRDIVIAMKEFSHPGTGQITHEDINKAIITTITVARNEWKYVADVVTDLDSRIISVPVDIGPIKQTILNLIVNAAHTIEDRVKLGSFEKGVITIRSKLQAKSIVIEIEDTGMGMSKKVADRVFDPFFTTKEVGKGTGQGLSMAYDIVVRKHKGKLYFKTMEGVGTTFFIELPIESSMDLPKMIGGESTLGG